MIKVLFVCLGNICRSPMAKSVFSDLLNEKGVSKIIEVDSCGTSGYHQGEDADPRTLDTLYNKNHSLEHSARKLTRQDFYNFDYIIAMDESNVDDIKSMAPVNSNAEIFLFRSFESGPGDLNVPDPYWSGQDGFEKVYNIVRDCSNGFLQYLDKKHSILDK